MSRCIVFVPLLLLVTGAVPADEVPETERIAESAGAQEQTEENAMLTASADEAPESEPVTDATETKTHAENGAKLVSGMSVLGNREAPKSLVIVPWKSSVIGDSLGIAPMLDDSRQPVDREVFMRALSYYEIQNGSHGSTAAFDGERDRK